ncbi:MAG: amidohydrolase family protein [Deltaproteobacteria bacterium]|nr:amidohydrolase family protein [Deltaproteobacteria bacterium]
MSATREQTDKDAWLASGEEEALEPALPICDPHHHLWDRDGSRYLLDELTLDTRAHRIEKTVFVECGSKYRSEGPEALRPVGETEFVHGIAEQSATGDYGPMQANAGIVGHADLLLGAAVDEVLTAHLAASPDRFRGIRHSAAWHPSEQIRRSHSAPPPHMLSQPKFREGFARLADHGLSFDAWLFHTQIDELTDLARAFEGTTIILDHVGGPLGIGPFEGRRAEVFPEWRRSISAIGRCPNVVVKLGGLKMPICGFGWHQRPRPPSSAELAETLGPYYLHCIEEFGPDRCMFESNFPVDKASCSYTVLWNCFKRLSEGFGEAERAALMHDTAVRVYRL